jgi:hypothetical protein
MVTVSVILVNYNGEQVVLDCLKSVQAQLQSYSYEVIVVDNASSDRSPDQIAVQFPTVKLLRQTENHGFGGGNNIGAAAATGEYLFLLNTDTQLTCDVLAALVPVLEQDPTIGIVAPQLLNPDGTLQLSTAPAISLWGEYQILKQLYQYEDPQHQPAIRQKFAQVQAVDSATGAALLMRRSLFEDLEGFDETFFMYFEDCDFCQRVLDRGLKIIYTPAVSLMHICGYSVKKVQERIRVEYRRSQLFYYRKHRPLHEQLLLRSYLTVKFTLSLLRGNRQRNLDIIRLALNLPQR